MQIDQNRPASLSNRQRTVEPPYTHEAHAAACRAAAQHLQVLQQHVQAKRGQVVYCAVIKGAWTTPDGKDCWTIETSWPERTRITVPVRNVIQCGGAACSCTDVAAPHDAGFSQADPDPAFRQAGVVAPPDSLNIENPPVSSALAF